MAVDTAECPSCEEEFERGPGECPHCGYVFAGDVNDHGRANRYRQERLAVQEAARAEEEMRAAREWADTLPPARPAQEQDQQTSAHPATITGWIALILGILIAGFALGMDVAVDPGFGANAYQLGIAVPSEVVNIDKVAARDMTFTTGVGLFLAGVVLIGVGLIMQAIDALQQRISTETALND